jgi:hypothetical protein
LSFFRFAFPKTAVYDVENGGTNEGLNLYKVCFLRGTIDCSRRFFLNLFNNSSKLVKVLFGGDSLLG